MTRTRSIGRSTRLLVTFSALVALLVAACAPAAAPSPTAAPAKPAATTAPAKPAEKAAEKPAAAKPAAKAETKAADKPAAKAADKPAAKAMSLPKPEITSIKIGHSALEPNGFPPELAQLAGFYKKYGFENVETFYFDGSAKTTQALVSDSVHAAGNSGGPALASQITSEPLQQVSQNISKMTDGLFTQGNVKSVQDLKGKSVAISQFGGESHAAVLLSLKNLGLNSGDVTIVQIGGQSARIAALKAGSVAAAPVDTSRRSDMEAQGFNMLVNLAETDLEFARTGLNLKKSFVEKNPNTVLNMVAANLEAQNFIFTNTPQAMEHYATWTQNTDKAQVEKDMKTYMEVANRTLRIKGQGFEAMKEVMAVENPAVANVDINSAFTNKFLDQLEQMGLYETLKIPTNR